MKNKFLKIALTVLTIAVVGQIGMRLIVPQPEEAKATHSYLSINLAVLWFVPEYDFNPVIELCDLTGEVLAGWSSELQPSTTFEDFDKMFYNVPNEAVRFRISWDRGEFDWVEDDTPIEEWINWGTASIEEQTHVFEP